MDCNELDQITVQWL